MEKWLNSDTNEKKYQLTLVNRNVEKEKPTLRLEISRKSHGVRGIKNFFGL